MAETTGETPSSSTAPASELVPNLVGFLDIGPLVDLVAAATGFLEPEPFEPELWSGLGV